MANTITRWGRFNVGDFVDHLREARPDGSFELLPRGLFVTRVITSRSWTRDELDDCDDFFNTPGVESTLEVEERDIDPTPRWRLNSRDPRYAFGPRPGDWFRYDGQLLRECYQSETLRPLGEDNGARPEPGDEVEIVKREYQNYTAQSDGRRVTVSIPHPIYADDGRLVYEAAEFEVVSRFVSLGPLGHSERSVVTTKPREFKFNARHWCRPTSTGVWDENRWDISLQVADDACSILTLRPLHETQTPIKSEGQLRFEAFAAGPSLGVLSTLPADTHPSERWGIELFLIDNHRYGTSERVFCYLRPRPEGGYDVLGGFNWITATPRGLESEAEQHLLSNTGT